MKSIFKHSEKIDISAIADNEASKITSFLFTIHKSFCSNCKKVFNDYQTLGLKIAKSFDKKLINTGSERVFNFYSATLKAAVYALVVGVTFSSVGIAFAQTQTDVDIIPDVTFFEDGEIISFSEEEVENLFTEVIDPIQATLITFIEPDEITVDEVVNEIEDQVEVLTTLVPEDVVTEEEPVVTEEEPVVIEEEPVVTEEEPVVTEEEPVVTEEEQTGLQNALNQVEQNIALAIQNNNENALNGLENAKEKILENIEKAEEKLQKGNEKAEEKLQKGNEKAKKEIEEAKEKADKILAKVDPSSDEKEVVKAQLKAERTLQKAEEKAQKEIEKAQKEAEKELEKAQKEAKEETEKAQKEAEKTEKKAQKESEKKDK